MHCMAFTAGQALPSLASLLIPYLACLVLVVRRIANRGETVVAPDHPASAHGYMVYISADMIVIQVLLLQVIADA
jgi:hypothetical protein